MYYVHLQLKILNFLKIIKHLNSTKRLTICKEQTAVETPAACAAVLLERHEPLSLRPGANTVLPPPA